ncbi:GTP 3',8-cyclase MoaA [Actinobaculum sp. 352]|uniref:GTP 3',8-cyclase MoaA n=1 Tax=Actinobaculum sp. 352 TaxID=2490946 RepID=UPI000F7D9B68|nr:GTP 3',8-cyclase MoaA [Actinobaculum sp. 352]RTE49205.1 GTP 3',8-cyclase MoaA [Actinobaculum sp. 352]
MNATSVPTPARAKPVVLEEATAPATTGLVDRFGRVARDLRVSLTDKCNLRCQYCMPAEGITPLPTARLLSDAEIIRLVRLAVEQLGIREVRFTGGEPLLRKGLENIVAATAALRTDLGTAPDISLTTNGLGLTHRAAALKEAGLARVNISMDAASAETYAKLTRRNRYDDAVAGAAAATAAGLHPVKLNAVLLPGVNAHEAPALLAQALRGGYRLRFIEFMPLGPRNSWKREELLTADDILAALSEHFTLTPRPAAERGAAPAQEWDVAAGFFDGQAHPAGRVGIIASVTRPFCGDCDRTRLTADGQICTCLFAAGETDLRGPLRAGASDAELAEIWRHAMWGKQAGHGMDDPAFLQPTRPMSAIGG